MQANFYFVADVEFVDRFSNFFGTVDYHLSDTRHDWRHTFHCTFHCSFRCEWEQMRANQIDHQYSKQISDFTRG